MPWRCPGCRLPIHHIENEARPRPGIVYRCHICRLELVVDETTAKMIVAPLNFERSEKDSHQ
jgi:hypothetical protein